jgi:TolB-like protein/DNA-binding winged helix-turn-helix (wHTH) protein/Flp pilus assembly protein TadD
MPRPEPRPIFRFLEFELDLAAFQLRRNGRPVRLERQPMDLLILLVERRDALVTRDEIVDRLWGRDVFVDVETGVHTAIRKIRQALRDDPDAARYVETVTGRGYRFVAPVEVVGAGEAPPAEPRAGAPPPAATAAVPERRPAGPTLLVLALAAAAVVVALALQSPDAPPERTTIAVLPFENLTGDAGREYLADGLAEETIATLGQLDPDRVRVIGRTSVLRYKGSRKSLAEIGAELATDYLVEGSIRAEGGQLRITSRLVRVGDQTQVWSASFDRRPTSVVGLQQELSAAIARRVHLRLSPERLSALARRHTADAEAYDLYLRGRFFWNQVTPATNARALEYFERAIALDPDYALAWAGITGVVLASPINSDVPPATVAARGREAAARALAAGPELAEAHSAQAFASFVLDWDWAAAEREFRRAIALGPDDAYAHRLLGHTLSQAGRQDEATGVMARARELEPFFAMNHALSSQVAFQGRDHEAALGHARRAVAIDPEFWIGHVMLAQAAEQLGQHDLALEALGHAARFSANNTKTMSFRGHLFARVGRTDEAREVLRALDAVARQRYVPPYAIALVHAGLGECDAALDRLEEALAARDVHLIFLHVDPRWDGCRATPRFSNLVERAGLTRASAVSSPAPASGSP